jgi:hypothetical protein
VSEPLIMTALAAVKATGEVVTVFKDAVEAVQSLPKANAVNLCRALDEVHKEVQVLLQAVAGYRGLATAPDFERVASTVLTPLDGPALRVHVKSAGGSCHIIRNIYTDHLGSWWFEKLRPEKHRQMTECFERLGEADGTLFAQMEQVCAFLEREARVVLDLVLEEKWALARDRAKAGREALSMLASDMATIMEGLIDVRDSALQRAEITSLGSPS